jgi:hypothetical protein
VAAIRLVRRRAFSSAGPRSELSLPWPETRRPSDVRTTSWCQVSESSAARRNAAGRVVDGRWGRPTCLRVEDGPCAHIRYATSATPAKRPCAQRDGPRSRRSGLWGSYEGTPPRLRTTSHVAREQTSGAPVSARDMHARSRILPRSARRRECDSLSDQHGVNPHSPFRAPRQHRRARATATRGSPDSSPGSAASANGSPSVAERVAIGACTVALVDVALILLARAAP